MTRRAGSLRVGESRLRGMLRRKQRIRQFLTRTGLMTGLRRWSAHGQRLEVTRHDVAARVPEPLAIAHLSDLHLLRVGAFEREILERVRAESPDAIVVTGDLAGVGGTDAAYTEFLSGLSAPRGVWMVLGNWDHWAPPDDVRRVCERSGVRLLVNESAELAPGVWVAGFDDAVAGDPDADRALAGIPPGVFVLGLFHCPVYLDAIAGRVDVALAGHTHGGQIRVPGLPPVFLPRGSWPYVAGWYAKSGTRMYVTRGLGSPGIPVRVFCRPEIAMVTLRP